jgi:hypothetical protein
MHDSTSFTCSALNLVIQINRQNKISYTFKNFICDEIFDILILKKRIRIPTDRVISSLGKCAYCKCHDSFLIILVIVMYFVDNYNQLSMKAG